MLRGRRAVRLVPFPGFGTDEEPIHVGVRILTEEEVDAARTEATQYVEGLARKYKVDAREMLSLDAETLDREVQRQLVFRAFMDPEKVDADGVMRAPFFVAAQGVRQLDTVMQQTLFNVYLDHQNYVNPMRGMSEGEVAELSEALGKGAEPPVLLGLYDAPTLRSLVHILAGQLRSSRTSKSSDGGSDATRTTGASE